MTNISHVCWCDVKLITKFKFKFVADADTSGRIHVMGQTGQSPLNGYHVHTTLPTTEWRHHRSITSKSLMPTAPSYIDNTPSTIIYTRWSSRHEVLGCHPPMGTTWKPGPDFRTITDIIKWLFVIYFWHNKGHGTYDTYIVRSHHKRLAFPPWNQQTEIVYKNSAGSSQLGSMGDRFTGLMCYMSTPIREKKKEKGKKNLHPKMIKTNQQVKHYIWMKNIYFL